MHRRIVAGGVDLVGVDARDARHQLAQDRIRQRRRSRFDVRLVTGTDLAGVVGLVARVVARLVAADLHLLVVARLVGHRGRHVFLEELDLGSLQVGGGHHAVEHARAHQHAHRADQRAEREGARERRALHAVRRIHRLLVAFVHEHHADAEQHHDRRGNAGAGRRPFAVEELHQTGRDSGREQQKHQADRPARQQKHHHRHHEAHDGENAVATLSVRKRAVHDERIGRDADGDGHHDDAHHRARDARRQHGALVPAARVQAQKRRQHESRDHRHVAAIIPGAMESVAHGEGKRRRHQQHQQEIEHGRFEEQPRAGLLRHALGKPRPVLHAGRPDGGLHARLRAGPLAATRAGPLAAGTALGGRLRLRRLRRARLAAGSARTPRARFPASALPAGRTRARLPARRGALLLVSRHCPSPPCQKARPPRKSLCRERPRNRAWPAAPATRRARVPQARAAPPR